MKNKIILFDTETTGKNLEDRILQLSFKLLGPNPVQTQLFNPGVPIHYEAMATHHITEETVRDLKPFKESVVFAALHSLANREESIFVAHNAPFDIQMLKSEGIEIKRFIDTLKVARRLFDDEPIYKLQYLRYRLGLKIEARAHDAEGDVAVLEVLFNRLCEEYESKKEDDSEDDINKCIAWMEKISKEPALLKRMPFGKHKGLLFSDVPKDYLEWLMGKEDVDGDLRFTCGQFLDKKLTT